MQLGLGCSSRYDLTVRDYVSAASTIRLGSTKSEVSRTLEPTQRRLPATERLQPEMYTDADVLTEIVYFRSRNSGGSAFEQFTPYVFEDGRLVAVGWTALGRRDGVRRAGLVRARAYSVTTILPPF